MAQNEPKDGRWRPLRGWRIHEIITSSDPNEGPIDSEKPDMGPIPDSDNPWLLLHAGDRNTVMPPLEAQVRRTPSQPPAQVLETSATPVPSAGRTTVRWLNEGGSPYGFSDEDGSLKQGDSDTWRRAFSGTRAGTEAAPARTDSSGRPPRGTGATGPSTWFLQALAAAAVVVVGLYSVHNQSTAATDIRDIYQTAFSQDQGSGLWQRSQRFLSSHHLGIPLLSTNFGAIRLHVPLAGRIISDYSIGQPEMVIQGNAGERVLAAGSGTVTKITAMTGGGNFIEINHGSIGTSWYTGVVKPTVRVNEYVTAGQVIGALPAQPKHPQLRFALEKNSQFENPHDYIVFPNQAPLG